ncbi:hypothetical protein ACHAWF_005932 [Thalassiosira exigua]
MMKQPQAGFDLSLFRFTQNDLGLDTILSFGPYIHDRTSDSSDALDTMADPKKQSPYHRTLKAFRECASAAKSDEDVDEIIGSFVRLKAEFIGSSQQIQDSQVHDFPSQEKRKKVKSKGNKNQRELISRDSTYHFVVWVEHEHSSFASVGSCGVHPRRLSVPPPAPLPQYISGMQGKSKVDNPRQRRRSACQS